MPTEEISFKEKLRSIQWSPAAKNPGSRRNYFDEEALRSSNLHADKAEEMEKSHGMGFMRRDSRGEFYRKDKITGDYIKATPKDLDVALGGIEKDTSRRSFGSNGKSG